MNVKITKEDLEEIRRAVIEYYNHKKPPFWNSFVEELKRGAVIRNNDAAGIGIWILEARDNGLALVRQPPISPEMRYFGVSLVNEDNKWRAVGDFDEKERLDLR